MKVSEVIKQLQEIQKQYGDLPVVGSSDEEQNSLGEVFQIQCGELTEYDYCNSDSIKVGDKVIVIVPGI